jgi:hypothetical protein
MILINPFWSGDVVPLSPFQTSWSEHWTNFDSLSLHGDQNMSNKVDLGHVTTHEKAE